MDRCDKCGQIIRDVNEPPPEKKPVPPDFADKCFLMLKGELKPHEEKFIKDCRGKTELSEKQWKWWAAIHKNCFGDWPSRERTVEVKSHQAPTLTDDDLKNTF